MMRILALAVFLAVLPAAAAEPDLAPLTTDQPAAEEAPAATAGDARLEDDLKKALQKDQPAQNSPPAQPAPAAAQTPAVARGVQSLNPDLSLIGDFALAAFSVEHPDQRGGHDPVQNGFNLQSVELALQAAVDPYFRMNANLAFSPEGFELEEAYATTTSLPANLQLKAGQFLALFGRQNPMHPHAWEFADQPLVLGKLLGPDGMRGPGAQVSWLASFLPWYLELVASATTPDASRSFLDESGRAVGSPADLAYTGALRQFFAVSDDWSLAWGLSAAAGPSTFGGDGRAELYGTDLYLKYRPLSGGTSTIVALTVEGLVRRRHDGGKYFVDGGGYAQLFWRFSQRWSAGARGEWVSGAAGDPLDPEWTKGRPRGTAALTFWPTEFSRVRLQGSVDRAPGVRDPVLAAFLAFEFSAGAHGAHTF